MSRLLGATRGDFAPHRSTEMPLIHESPQAEVSAHHVPFARFFLWTSAQFALAIGVFAWLAPVAFKAEISHPAAIVFWTLAAGLPISLFEYLYHRYLLHSAVLPFLGSMHRAHGLHHSLTAVKAPVRADEPARLVEVKSEFPVEHEHQDEAMMFPFYAVSIFNAIFLILIGLPMKLLFPGAPIYLSVITAVTLYYASYEFSHALLHLPFERYWRPLFNSRSLGRMFQRIYGFHLMHHWRPSANLAIVGFWGVALWDHLFRTHRRPERMPLHMAEVTYADAVLSTPLWPVSMLDRWQGKFFKTSRRIEGFFARVFLRRKPTTR